MKKYLLTAVAAVTVSSQALAMSETLDTGYTETKYPIVLVHGFLGFEQLVGVMPGATKKGRVRKLWEAINELKRFKSCER